MADKDNEDTIDDLMEEDIGVEEPLDEDFDKPFSEPRAQEDKLNPQHPQTDTDLDSHELYDEGLSGASEVDLPESPDVGEYEPEDKNKT